MEQIYFFIIAIVAVVSAVLVVSCKSPINNAVALMMTFVCLANFYVMLHAPFMAAVQIMVYAGAILMLIVFVIMLLNLNTVLIQKTSHSVVGAITLAGLVFFQLYYMLGHSSTTSIKGDISNELVMEVGHTQLLAKSLFVEFLLPFEIASILLLVAVIGAVVLSKRNAAAQE
ncbi:MAG: NADH-quinone oxidoreductase subunit J [Desulfuromonadales bacterium]|nr:NADH-quinone oxidoreductase subunit J [Desulfuromonadales bacterium]